jgi:ribose 5-phosphate isomerase B
MRIAIGADANGYALKEVVKQQLLDLGHDVEDFGVAADESTDYPDIALRVAHAVADGSFPRAVLVCGTGLGMAIVANKVPGVRAAAVTDPYSAERARASNDAQVLCLGGHIVGTFVAAILVKHWLDTEFAGGRSTPKVEKIKAIDALVTGTVAAGETA